MPFFSRLIFAIVAWFKILFDGEAAARMAAAAEGAAPALPEKQEERPAAKKEPPAPAPAAIDPAEAKARAEEGALQLLALMQREGRLVDFLEEDIAGAADADIGAAARVVHAGCRKALRAHVTLAPVRAEEEGAKVTLAEADPAAVKLTGNVTGKGPYNGILRHRGWRATELKLPTAVGGHDPRVVAQAEVEL